MMRLLFRILPGIVEVERSVKILDLFINGRERHEVFIIVKVDSVLNVLPILWMFSVGVTVISHLRRVLECHFLLFNVKKAN